MGRVSDMVIGLLESVTEDEAKDIKDYAEDHYKNFGFWPHDVEVGDKVLSYHDYQIILRHMEQA